MAFDTMNDMALVKTEGTYGTAETTAIDDIVVTTGKANWSPDAADWKQRDLAVGQQGSQREYAGTRHATLGLPVELAGGGAAGAAPQFDALMLACGFAATTTPSTSVVYDPVSGVYSSVTARYNVDGLDQVIKGARGNAVISGPAGEVPKITFSMMGIHQSVTEAAAPGGSLPTITDGVPVNNANTIVALGGTELAVSEFSIDCGRSPVFDDIAGLTDVRINSRKATGSMTVELPALSDKNLLQECEQNGLQALKITHGTVPGNIVVIDAPKVQIKCGDPTDRNGVLAMPLTLVFTPDSGDDELKITIK